MNETNQSLTSSGQSLRTNDDIQSAVQRFGTQYMQFLRKYPTLQNRTDSITSVADAVRRGGMSLAQVDRHFRPGASEYWLKVMLTEMLMFLGALDAVQPFQVKGIAARIRQEHYYLTPAELTFFFYSFSIGDYGKLYASRSVNPQDILIALRSYLRLVFQQRAELSDLAVESQRRADLADPRNISWEKYCASVGRDPHAAFTRNPLKIHTP